MIIRSLRNRTSSVVHNGKENSTLPAVDFQVCGNTWRYEVRNSPISISSCDCRCAFVLKFIQFTLRVCQEYFKIVLLVLFVRVK